MAPTIKAPVTRPRRRRTARTSNPIVRVRIAAASEADCLAACTRLAAALPSCRMERPRQGNNPKYANNPRWFSYGEWELERDS